MALNGYDDRFGANRRSQPKQVDEIWILWRQYARRLSGRKSRYIEPRAKIGADAVEHGDAQPVILLKLIDCFPQSDDRGGSEATLCLRQIKADEQHGAASLYHDPAQRRQ